ncbi:MAG: TIGR02996 domain-containing protein [Planctomycetes bacterium]|nr:TIGR02996 domain-containing protein [Planctomycetota bacterium]
MDLLSQHEAFLRAIFDNPEDDTARLVYADFLQENGEEDRAELIRVQLDPEFRSEDPSYWWGTGEDDTWGPWDPDEKLKQHGEEQSRWVATQEKNEWFYRHAIPWHELPPGCEVKINRGLWHDPATGGVAVSGKELDDPRKFREWVVRVNPAWYGERKLVVRAGSQISPEHIRTLCELPFIRQVTDWNLSGLYHVNLPYTEWSDADESDDNLDFLPMTPGTDHRPVVTPAGVNVLARLRAASRITSLDLRNNNLDNDAARALAQSPYLDNLKQLLFLQGNDVSGKVWQKVIERFGEKVAG